VTERGERLDRVGVARRGLAIEAQRGGAQHV
jgi:hypothetical protein